MSFKFLTVVMLRLKYSGAKLSAFSWVDGDVLWHVLSLSSVLECTDSEIDLISRTGAAICTAVLMQW